jgi:glycosyltransferase involved in cell wall biosynthesis/peptidoglycan/xylan/chitin deacetylase (PgdA/CDA1 family)
VRILWVKIGALLPLDSGGKLRTHAMLTEISRAHDVVYLSILPDDARLDEREEPDPYAAEKIWFRAPIARKGSLGFWTELAWSFISTSRPYALQRYEVPGFTEKLRELSKTQNFDLAVCDFLAPALNFVDVHFACPVLLFQHNVEALIWQRLAAGRSSPIGRWFFRRQHRRMQHWEARLSSMFDGVVTVSPEDAELARSEYGLTNVLGHVPTGVDAGAFKPAPPLSPELPPTIGFLGAMDWMPNIEGVFWFVREVLALVRQRVPRTRLKIIGRNPPPSIRALATAESGIEVTGTVEDVQPHVHQCNVIVVPLLSGGGTRIKIFECMAMGVAVVSTTIGAEGLPLVAGEDLQIADSIGSFTDAVTEILQNPELAQKLAQRARERTVREFGWQAAASKFVGFGERVSKRTTPPSRMETRVLMYHDVVPGDDQSASGFRMPGSGRSKLLARDFERHLHALAEAGTGAPGKITDASLPRWMITFDDGGIGAMTAADLLERHQWHGHFFITTSMLGEPGFLSRQQLRELASRGHVIGSHSHSHPVPMSGLTPQDLAEEWKQSIRILTAVLDQPVLSASVPGGFHNPAVAAAAAKAGIRYVFTSEPTPRVRQREGHLELGRFAIGRSTGAECAAALANGGWACHWQKFRWEVLKLAKKLLGPWYLRIRSWVLGAR